MTEPLPAAEPAEKGLLSSFFHTPDRLYALCAQRKVAPEWFCQEDHSTIFSMFMDMGKEKVPIDLISACQWISDHKVHFLTDTPDALLAEILGFVHTSANADYYITVLQDTASRKLAILECQAIEKKLREEAITTDDVFNIATGAFQGVKDICIVEDNTDWDKQEIMAFMDKMQAACEGKGSNGLMPFGLPAIDLETGGAQRGELIVVHAPTSCGKSLLAKKFTQHAVFDRGEKAAVFSIEMLYEQCLRRYVADLGNISLQSMRRGIFSKAEFASFGRTMGRIGDAPLSIYDVKRNEMTPESIEREIRKLKKNKGLDVVMCDYLQLLRIKKKGKGDEKRRDQDLQAVSTNFKLLAQELDLMFILVAQANENGSCFDSSQVESDADWVFNLMPTFKMEGKIRRITGTDGLWIAKSREGERGKKVPLVMEGKYARISQKKEAVTATDVF